MRYCFLWLLLALALPWSARGQAPSPTTGTYGGWHSSRIGGGGYLQYVLCCPSDPARLYTYVDVAGSWRSDDGGKSWRMLEGALPPRRACYSTAGMSVDPRDADRLLIAVGAGYTPPEGIYASHDGGASWRPTLTGVSYDGNGPHRMDGRVLVRHPREEDLLLTAGIGSGVYRSRDNGDNWVNIGLANVYVTDLCPDRANPDRWWVCAQPTYNWLGGFYRTTDGGKSWTKLSETSPRELLQDPRDPGLLYGTFDRALIKISRDGGQSWTPLSDGLNINPADARHYPSDAAYNALAAGPDFILTASARGTFYKLPCGETHWQKIPRGTVERRGSCLISDDMFGSELGSITVDPHTADHWFFTDWYAIYETTDAGRDWTLRVNGIEDTVIHCLAQDPSDPAMVHLGMADLGYCYSHDGGTSYQHDAEGISNNIKCIDVSPSRPARVYAVGPKGWGYEANQVFISNDHGRSWTRSAMRGLPDGNCNTIAVDPHNPDLVYLAVAGTVAPGKGGPYFSRDGGQSWSWMGTGLPDGKAFFNDSIWAGGVELAVGRDGTLLATGTATWQVFRRLAGSAQWQAVAIPLAADPTYALADPFTPGRFYVSVYKDALFRSDDAGATWRRLPVPRGVYHTAIDRALPGRLACDTADGIILSTDGGDTWQDLDKHLPERSLGNPLAFAGNRLLAGSGGSGAFWIALGEAGK